MPRGRAMRPPASSRRPGRPAVLLSSVCALVLTAACTASRPPEMKADLILTGGAVVTGDPRQPEAQAVAVRGDSILAVGTDAEIAALAGPATRRIVLRGRMLVPGLTDAHGHVHSLGDELANLDLHGVASAAEIARLVEERGRTLPAGAWVTG